MKRLKTYKQIKERLSTDKYISTARKLKDIGHVDRHDDIFKKLGYGINLFLDNNQTHNTMSIFHSYKIKLSNFSIIDDENSENKVEDLLKEWKGGEGYMESIDEDCSYPLSVCVEFLFQIPDFYKPIPLFGIEFRIADPLIAPVKNKTVAEIENIQKLLDELSYPNAYLESKNHSVILYNPEDLNIGNITIENEKGRKLTYTEKSSALFSNRNDANKFIKKVIYNELYTDDTFKYIFVDIFSNYLGDDTSEFNSFMENKKKIKTNFLYGSKFNSGYNLITGKWEDYPFN